MSDDDERASSDWTGMELNDGGESVPMPSSTPPPPVMAEGAFRDGLAYEEDGGVPVGMGTKMGVGGSPIEMAGQQWRSVEKSLMGLRETLAPGSASHLYGSHPTPRSPSGNAAAATTTTATGRTGRASPQRGRWLERSETLRSTSSLE